MRNSTADGEDKNLDDAEKIEKQPTKLNTTPKLAQSRGLAFVLLVLLMFVGRAMYTYELHLTEHITFEPITERIRLSFVEVADTYSHPELFDALSADTAGVRYKTDTVTAEISHFILTLIDTFIYVIMELINFILELIDSILQLKEE